MHKYNNFIIKLCLFSLCLIIVNLFIVNNIFKTDSEKTSSLNGQKINNYNSQMDYERYRDIDNIATQMNKYYQSNGVLPESLHRLTSEFPTNITDPQTKENYIYKINSPKSFSICANYNYGDEDEPQTSSPIPGSYNLYQRGHKKGYSCTKITITSGYLGFMSSDDQDTDGKIYQGITNGQFNKDIQGWSLAMRGDADILWEDGKLKLRINKCSNSSTEQAFVINGDLLSFDYITKAEMWYENPRFKLTVKGKNIAQGDLPIQQGSVSTGNKQINLSGYKGKKAVLTFSIFPSLPCSNSDHGDTFLWIDNVTLK